LGTFNIFEVSATGEVSATPFKTWTTTVWPTATPPIEGTLVDLDTLPTTTVTVRGGSSITIRTSERATSTGYMFNDLASDTTFTCLTLVTSNLGNFNVGYKQYHFIAKDDELTCSESLTFTKSVHATSPGTPFLLAVTVEKAFCSAEIVCATGETVNAYTCLCMTEPAV